MKQTAVEWLIDELTETKFLWLSDKPEMISLIKIINQAKEMEKQQIIDAANLQRNDYRGMPTYNKSGEQYYNKTYKK